MRVEVARLDVKMNLLIDHPNGKIDVDTGLPLQLNVGTVEVKFSTNEGLEDDAENIMETLTAYIQESITRSLEWRMQNDDKDSKFLARKVAQAGEFLAAINAPTTEDTE